MQERDDFAACLSNLPTTVAGKVQRKIGLATGFERQHTLNELIVGAYLARQRLNVDYERDVEGRTPDWTVVKPEGEIACIIDVVTYNLPAAAAQKIEQARGTGLPAVYWPEDPEKMWSALDKKAGAYDKLATTLNVPYVVAIFGHFAVAVEFAEIRAAAEGDGDLVGVFAGRPALSGILFAREACARFWFDFLPNPNAHHTWTLSSERWPDSKAILS